MIWFYNVAMTLFKNLYKTNLTIVGKTFFKMIFFGYFAWLPFNFLKMLTYCYIYAIKHDYVLQKVGNSNNLNQITCTLTKYNNPKPFIHGLIWYSFYLKIAYSS